MVFLAISKLCPCSAAHPVPQMDVSWGKAMQLKLPVLNRLSGFCLLCTKSSHNSLAAQTPAVVTEQQPGTGLEEWSSFRVVQGITVWEVLQARRNWVQLLKIIWEIMTGEARCPLQKYLMRPGASTSLCQQSEFFKQIISNIHNTMIVFDNCKKRIWGFLIYPSGCDLPKQFHNIIVVGAVQTAGRYRSSQEAAPPPAQTFNHVFSLQVPFVAIPYVP